MDDPIIVGEETLDRDYVADLKEWSKENDKRREREREQRKRYKKISPLEARDKIMDYRTRKAKTTIFTSADDYERVFGER